METKLGKGIIITISILIVLVISIFIYIFYQGRVINDLNLKINEQKLNAELLDDNESKTEVVEKAEDNKKVETEAKKEENEVVNSSKNEGYKSYSFNENNVVGKKSNIHYRNRIENNGIYIEKLEGNVVKLNVSSRAFASEDLPYSTSVKEVKTSKNISEVFSGGIGQGLNGSLLVFLLEDGSVEYINLFDSVTKNNYSVKRIPELHNVVKFYNVDGYDEVAGWVTILAQSSDGKIYDLDDFIDV